MDQTTRLKPIIRWVGGKAKLLPQIIERIPTFTGTYYEPFVGGAAVVLGLMPTKAVVADKSEELINFYNEIKRDPNGVCEIASSFRNDSVMYYEVRSWDKDPDFVTNVEAVRRAGRYLYLNKTCFNGLMRVNTKKGYNNTPYGRPRDFEIDVEKFATFSKAVQHITFRCSSFESIIDLAIEDDFVYLDPPYVPVSETASYTAYTLGGFTMEDQVRLRDCCDTLTQRGVKFLLSNSDCEQTRALYKNFIIDTVGIKRTVSAKSSSRVDTTEVLVRNYALSEAEHAL